MRWFRYQRPWVVITALAIFSSLTGCTGGVTVDGFKGWFQNPTVASNPVTIESRQVEWISPEGAVRSPAQVIRVVDGDTVDVDLNGARERLRLIGIDTPEIVDRRKPIQCYAREASAKAHELLPEGQAITLESDPSVGERDSMQQPRLLRYIWLPDDRLFNEVMIREGYAHEYTYRNQFYKYQAQFKEAVREAREASVGLWSPETCGGETEKPAA